MTSCRTQQGYFQNTIEPEVSRPKDKKPVFIVKPIENKPIEEIATKWTDKKQTLPTTLPDLNTLPIPIMKESLEDTF